MTLIINFCLQLKKTIGFCSTSLFMGLLFIIPVGLTHTRICYAQPETVVNHYDKGFSPIFRVYLTEVLKTVLDKSIVDYGPYKLQFYTKILSTNRSKLETEKGALIDILFASHWNGRYVRPENVIAIEAPIFNGLLGLRSFIVREGMDETMNQVQSVQEFKQYIAGQGANWEDVRILTSNDIPVTEAQSFDALFPMLAKMRYDYLSLSCLEVQTAIRTKAVNYESLKINNNIGIFYPLPFYLFVNAKKPELAERIKKGFEIATRDGTIEKLFNQHFSNVKQDFELGIKKLIVLQNPYLSEETNHTFTEQFLSQNQQYFEVLQ